MSVPRCLMSSSTSAAAAPPSATTPKRAASNVLAIRMLFSCLGRPAPSVRDLQCASRAVRASPAGFPSVLVGIGGLWFGPDHYLGSGPYLWGGPAPPFLPPPP